MKALTVRVSDDLHARVREVAGPESVSGFVREAIAEKVGRTNLERQVDELRDRVTALERERRPS